MNEFIREVGFSDNRSP